VNANTFLTIEEDAYYYVLQDVVTGKYYYVLYDVSSDILDEVRELGEKHTCIALEDATEVLSVTYSDVDKEYNKTYWTWHHEK